MATRISLTETQRRRFIKEISSEVKDLQKIIDASNKPDPHEKAWEEWENENGLISECNKLLGVIDELNNHPVRYENLVERLRNAGKKEGINVKAGSKDYLTIMDALEKASKYQALCAQNNRIMFKNISAMTALNLGKGTSEYNPVKNLRDAAQKMGWSTGGKGKRASWPPGRLDFLKQDYLEQVGENPSQEDKENFINERYTKYGCASPNALARKLTRAGLKNIPHFDYHPKKK